jgi:hypothetical protein
MLETIKKGVMSSCYLARGRYKFGRINRFCPSSPLFSLFIAFHCLHSCSCKIVALRENVVDRPESYDLFSTGSCIFLELEKMRMV